jgi:thiosulfate reductase cytochrome b subunit
LNRFSIGISGALAHRLIWNSVSQSVTIPRLRRFRLRGGFFGLCLEATVLISETSRMPAEKIDKDRRIKVHSGFVRLTHWINAIAIIIMIGSGWRIYNNVPIFSWLTFPEWATLGGDPEITYKLNKDVGFSNALLWHFAAMWVFFVNGIVALAGGILSGRLWMKWLPVTPSAVVQDVKQALSFNLAHDDIRVYNAVQKLLYIGVILATVLMLVSGLAIWKPVQFQTLTWLFYDFQGARLAHFLGMSAIVLFLAVHVTLAILVPKTITAITSGSIRSEPESTRHPMPAGE